MTTSLISVTFEGIRYQGALLTPDGAVAIDTREHSKVSANVAPSPEQFRRAAHEARELGKAELQAARGWKRQTVLGVECDARVARRVRRARWWTQQARWLDNMGRVLAPAAAA